MKKITCVIVCFLLSFCSIFAFGCRGCSTKTPRSEYDIAVTLTGNELKGKQTFSFYNSYETSFTVLKFNLYGNAYRENAKYSPVLAQYYSLSYPNGVSYGSLVINSVSQEGKQLTFSICGQDQNILEVILLREVFPSEKAIIEIDYTLKLANVVSRTGINEKTINLGNFYPILCAYQDSGFYECEYYGFGDPFYSECADYNVKITCPSNYVVASSGTLVSEQVDKQAKTYIFSIQNARSFAMVLSTDFMVETATVEGVSIKYYYYQDQTPKESLKHACNALKLFSNKFGKYPYDTFSVVQTGFVQGGMEYPSLVMISDSLEPTAYGEVIVHETAHQWWQTVVGNNEIEHGFLDEGLTEYSVVIYFENHPEYGMSRENMINSAQKTYNVFCSVMDRLNGSVNTNMLRGLKDYKSEYEYVNQAYIRPCIMYDVLRKTVGESMFFKGLKKYYETYSFKNATPYDIVGIYEKLGADTNGFFESFYTGKAII